MTCTELFELLTLLQTGKIAPLPVVLIGAQYWRRAIDVDFLLDEGMIAARDATLAKQLRCNVRGRPLSSPFSRGHA